jgi:starch phosphorylase
VPSFYERGQDGVPERWVALMRSSIGNLCQFFNTHRMVNEYTERLYLPAARQYRRLTDASAARASDLAEWRARVALAWPKVRVVAVETPVDGVLKVGEPLQARALVDLGGLAPDDVAVEFALGRVEPGGGLIDAAITPMRQAGAANGVHEYVADTFSPDASGLHGYSVRVLPRHPDLEQPFVPGLITWAG